MTEYKELRIEKQDGVGMYRILPKDRGAIPIELRGMYTSVGAAKTAIDRVDSHRGRKTKNAKTVSASRD